MKTTMHPVARLGLLMADGVMSAQLVIDEKAQTISLVDASGDRQTITMSRLVEIIMAEGVTG